MERPDAIQCPPARLDGLGSFSPGFRLSKQFLEATYHPGQFKQCGRGTKRFTMWPGWVTGPGFACGDVAEHSGLCCETSARTNRKMAADARLPGQNRAVADCYRTGDAYLCHDQALLSNPYVVRDVHKVIDLGSVTDDSVIDTAAVDGCIGANLDIVAD